MATAVVAVLLLVATVAGGGTAPAAAFSPEPVFYPHTRHTLPSLGRQPFLSPRALRALLANDTPLVDPTGTIPPDEIPAPVPVKCGGRMPRTAHTVRCGAGRPLGGIVLVPPRRATASLVFLHGFTDTPHIYLALLQTLLSSAPAAWASVRLVVPFAPRVPVQLEASPDAAPVYAWYDVSPSFNTTLATRPADAADAERLLLESVVDVDGLGLFLSTRRVEAIIAAEHRALGGRRDNKGSRKPAPGGRVVLAGHSLGAVMATHVALTSRVRVAAVVALQGFVADARRLSRVPGTTAPGRRGYPVELVSGGADVVVPPSYVAASAAIVRRLLKGAARVSYKELKGVTHSSFFLPGPDADAVNKVLTRHLK